MLDRLVSRLSMRADERRLVGLMLLAYFLLGIGFVLFNAAAFALFLTAYDASQLPVVYIVNAVVISLVSVAALRLGRRLSARQLLALTAAFFFVVLMTLRLGMLTAAAAVMFFALPTTFELTRQLSKLSFWGLALRVFDLQQSKRLFGVIGAGRWVATLVGGLTVPVIVLLLGTENILLVIALAYAAAFAVLLVVQQQFEQPRLLGRGADLADAPALAFFAGPDEEQGRQPLWRHPYVLLIFGLIAIWVTSRMVFENLYYGVVETQFGTEAALAQFLGFMAVVRGVVTLVTTILVVPWLNRRFGVHLALLAAPALMLLFTLTIIGGTLAGVPVVVFVLVVALQMISEPLEDGLSQGTVNVLYQPLPGSVRSQAVTVSEGIVDPTAMGLVGLFLLTFFAAFEVQSVHLAIVLMMAALGWLVMAWRTGQGYVGALRQALRRRRFGELSVELADANSLNLFREAARDEYAGAVLYALSKLEQLEDPELPALLGELVEHTDPVVRLEVLARIRRLRLTELGPICRNCLESEADATVKAEALRTLSAIDDGSAGELVATYLEAPNLTMAACAMEGLLLNDQSKGASTAGQWLDGWVRATDPARRAAAARVTGRVKMPDSERLLLALLDDEDVAVVNEALEAAGLVDSPTLWPRVLTRLDKTATAVSATKALAMGGPSLLPYLDEALRSPVSGMGRQVRVARVCGRLPDDAGIPVLRKHIDHPAAAVRREVLRSLRRLKYGAEEGGAAAIKRRIEVEMAELTAVGALYRGVTGPEWLETNGYNGDAVLAASGILQRALAEQMEDGRQRLFSLLSFIYDRQVIEEVEENLRGRSPVTRPYAIELLTTLLPAQWQQRLTAVLTEPEPALWPAAVAGALPQVKLPATEQLARMVGSDVQEPVGWLQVCALNAIGAVGLAPLLPQVRVASARPEPAVREAAYAVWRKLEAGTNDEWKEARMLSTVERVIILKSVTLFATIPDTTLAALAGMLKEVELEQGEMLFDKGDRGDSMYVIVDGRVRVYDGELTLNYLTSRNFFGEMAILDPEPRMASVEAAESTLLLQLEQDALFDLMEDHSEVARGLIQVLSRLLRARVQDMNRLRDELRRLETAVADENRSRQADQTVTADGS